MARTKITAYVTPDIAETLKRVAAIDDRSMSDIIEDAIIRRLSDADRGAAQAALMQSLTQITRRLGSVERNLETHFELTTQGMRFLLSLAPDIPEADWASRGARGRERIANILSIVIARLTTGRTTLQDAYNQAQTGVAGPVSHAAPASSTPASSVSAGSGPLTSMPAGNTALPEETAP